MGGFSMVMDTTQLETGCDCMSTWQSSPGLYAMMVILSLHLPNTQLLLGLQHSHHDQNKSM